MPERLQKVLARHGLGSRREVERWIAEGRITVNNKTAQIGDHIEPSDRVAIDRKEVTARLSIDVSPQVLIYHKSQGQPIERDDSRTAQHVEDIVTVEPDEDEPHESAANIIAPVIERLPAVRGARWVPINPMHPGDSGLLLATNDGKLGFALTRRKRWISSAYMVRVLAPGTAEAPPELPLSVRYDDGRGQVDVEFSAIEPKGGEGSNLWYRVELPRADRRAAVRAVFESHRLKVNRMTQVAFGGIELPRDLPRGRHRMLNAEQMATLYELAQIEVPTASESSASPHKKQRRGALTQDKRLSARNSNEKKPLRAARKKNALRGTPAPDRRRAPKNKSHKR